MPIEEQLLPHEDLKDWYDEVVWVYTCRTWRDDAKDKEAARIHDRFGITSFPHLYVVNPLNDEVLARLPRNVGGIAKGFAQAASEVPAPDAERAEDMTGMLRKVHESVEAVEVLLLQPGRARRELPALLEARTDIVLRIRIAQRLAETEPALLAKHAQPLLEVPNDTLRFTVLGAVEKQSVAGIGSTLARLFEAAGSEEVPSNNPNVLRSWAARCMVRSGDASCIDAVSGLAREANPLNGTTRAVVKALGAIGAREKGETRAAALAVLRDALPKPLDPEAEDPRGIRERTSLLLVATVLEAATQASGKDDLPAAPATWTQADRDALRERLADALD